jgi:glycosyltransferase 2 family protein
MYRDELSMKNIVLNMIIILFFLIALIVLVFFTSGIDELLYLIGSMRYIWILAALGCMIMYWSGEAVILHTTTQYLVERQKWGNSIRVTMIGQFFNAATPFASGGQAAQGYVMIKNGVMPGHTVLVIIIKSISYQLVVVFYSLVVLIFKTRFFLENIPHFTMLFIAGLVANAFVISLYAFLLINKTLATKIMFWGINILQNLKIIKKPFRKKKYLMKEVRLFSEGINILGGNVVLLVKTIVFQVLRLTFFFSIPFFIYLAIEKTTTNLLNVISAQALVIMTASYIPLPGSSGGAEGISYLFFKLFFKEKIIMSVVLIWRILTYYSNIIFGGLFTLFAPEKPLKKKYD